MRSSSALEVFTRVHGGRYDYSDMGYTRMARTIRVGCPIHGVFTIQARRHAEGSGCRICTGTRIGIGELIRKFVEAHGDKFDYRHVSETYTSMSGAKVRIICPAHGEFWVRPVNHLKTTTGCMGCAGDERTVSKEEVIRRIAEAGNSHLLPDDFEYRGMLTKCRVACPKHGDYFAYPVNLVRGHGCLPCSKRTSEEETAWLLALYQLLGDWRMTRGARLPGVDGPVDAIFFSPNGRQVAVEYDGSYWHRGASALARDERKTAQVALLEIPAIRLRAHPVGGVNAEVGNAMKNIHVPETRTPPSLFVEEIAAAIRGLAR